MRSCQLTFGVMQPSLRRHAKEDVPPFSSDDARQIQRWKACASPRGRWRNQLCGAVAKASRRFDDASVSPVIRQTLLHWAYELSDADYEAWRQAKRS